MLTVVCPVECNRDVTSDYNGQSVTSTNESTSLGCVILTKIHTFRYIWLLLQIRKNSYLFSIKFCCVLGRDRPIPHSGGVTHSQPATLSAKTVGHLDTPPAAPTSQPATMPTKRAFETQTHQRPTNQHGTGTMHDHTKWWTFERFQKYCIKEVTLRLHVISSDLFYILRRVCDFFVQTSLYVHVVCVITTMCSRPMRKPVDGRSFTRICSHSFTVL